MDLSPWLLLAIPMLVVFAYITARGRMRNEFRERGWGWHHYRSGSFAWWGATALNLMLLGSGLFITYETLFHGSEFDREPIRPMPRLSGQPTKTVHATVGSQQVALCLADQNHGRAYRLREGQWRVGIWNGRGAVMDTFEVADEASGSRVDIYRSFMSQFVDWNKCLSGGDEPPEPIIVAQSPD